MLISADDRTRHVTIPMPDGTLIAATLNLPAGEGPFPLLASFYPYRKDDFIGASTAYVRQYFADAGYASLLVDIRGYGSSGGRTYQAWDPREFDDGAEVVEWAARQPWCNGRVGVWGTSYGGAQSLGIATRRPAALKAIASIYGAADIYHDFVYPGGCPNGLGAAAWSAFVVALELAPPSLQDPEGRWLDAWHDRLARLDDGEISANIWPAHRDHDPFWQGRIIPVEDIEVPSYFLTGWRDLLCKGMIDAYRRCRAPKRLLAGPWSHAAPDAVAEAPYDWLGELRHWWDRWLGDGAADDRPAVVYQVQGANQWRGDSAWPPTRAATLTRFPAAGGRLGDAERPTTDEYRGRALVGREAGLWYPMGLALGGRFDQAADDLRSLAYTSDAVPATLTIAGSPAAQLDVELDGAGDAHLCVKLVHVDPNDHATLVSSGWHRVPAGSPRRSRVDIELYPTAYEIPAGHRYRWTVALADFPRVWPTAQQHALKLHGGSSFDLPAALSADVFDAPAPVSGVNRAPWIVAAEPICRLGDDAAGDGVSICAGMRLEIKLPQGGRMRMHHTVTAEMREKHAAGATIRTMAELDLTLASGEAFRVDTWGYATIGRRHLSGRITAGGQILYDRRWTTLNGKAIG